MHWGLTVSHDAFVEDGESRPGSPGMWPEMDADGMGRAGEASPSIPQQRAAERVLKFEIQLYKTRDSEYCLDMQVHN